MGLATSLLCDRSTLPHGYCTVFMQSIESLLREYWQPFRESDLELHGLMVVGGGQWVEQHFCIPLKQRFF